MLEDLEWHWLLWLLLPIPACYLLVPLVIWPLQRFPAHPDVQELDSRTLRKSLHHFLMTQANDLITWGLMHPMKAFRTAALRRREKAILEEFDRGRD